MCGAGDDCGAGDFRGALLGWAKEEGGGGDGAVSTVISGVRAVPVSVDWGTASVAPDDPLRSIVISILLW